MSVVVGAVAPVFLLILFGFLLRRRGFPGEGFWALAERLTYFVLFPALLAESLARAELDGLPVGPMAIVIVATTLIMTGAIALSRRFFALSGPAYTSVVQGAIRFNTYLGVAMVATLLGPGGVAIAALYLAIMVPFANLVCVWVLAVHATEGATDRRRVALEIVRNPLVVGCIAGLVLQLVGGAPEAFLRFLGMLGQASLPIGLLCAGAGLDPVRLVSDRRILALAAVAKLIAMPALMGIACAIAGIDGMALVVLVLFSALPSAPSAYILARQMGGDAPLMAAILTLQTGLSLATLPVVLTLAGATGASP
ncbi:MAG: AEC family transporter [Alphaproteobacteria bacterium]|nr:AEC family transporter [Alphaproteobacteria bacterium]